MPSVAYTDPEVAWAGLDRERGEADRPGVRKAVFPWSANARSLGIGRDEGQTKLLFDAESGRLVGAGLVGPRAGELIAEAVLAIELGTDAEDLALAIHPHPTLSETLGLAAELAAGTITDLIAPTEAVRPRAGLAVSRRRALLAVALGRRPRRRGGRRARDLRAPGETPVADVLQIIVLDRERGGRRRTGGQRAPRAPRARRVACSSTEAHGRVGVVLTDRRVLAVAMRSGAWQDDALPARRAAARPAPSSASRSRSS